MERYDVERRNFLGLLNCKTQRKNFLALTSANPGVALTSTNREAVYKQYRRKREAFRGRGKEGTSFPRERGKI